MLFFFVLFRFFFSCFSPSIYRKHLKKCPAHVWVHCLLDRRSGEFTFKWLVRMAHGRDRIHALVLSRFHPFFSEQTAHMRSFGHLKLISSSGVVVWQSVLKSNVNVWSVVHPLFGFLFFCQRVSWIVSLDKWVYDQC